MMREKILLKKPKMEDALRTTDQKVADRDRRAAQMEQAAKTDPALLAGAFVPVTRRGTILDS